MTAVIIDTHVLVWFLSDPGRLSAPAERALGDALDGGSGVAVSTVSLIELTYLAEKGRVAREVVDRVRVVMSDPGIPVDFHVVSVQVAEAVASIPRDIVPDMPDRIIAATARVLGLPLVTRDRALGALDIETVW